MSNGTTYTRRPIVYIAGPFRAANDYARKLHRDCAEALAFLIWSHGAIALTPHLNTANFDGALDDKIWLDGDLELLRRCDAIAMVRNWMGSEGAKAELAQAKAWEITVFYQSQRDDLVELQDEVTFRDWVRNWPTRFAGRS